MRGDAASDERQGLGRLLDRQASRWEIERGAGMPQQRAPVVAVSRWPGSQGDEVAAAIAAWLDYGFFGPAEIDALAGDAALRGRIEAGLDAAARDAIAARATVMRERAPGAPEAVVRVVATLGERGMAVVLGRGAAVILAPERTLRVLVLAGEASRAARLAAAQRVPAAEASACVASADAARHAALRERFGVASEDLTHYDLAINTDSLSIEAAAALSIEALRRRFPP
jgi:cytidylate kinase